MKTKVCHITSAHSRYDVRVFMKQCRSLAKNGYDVTLIVNDAKEDEVLDGVKIESTKVNPKNRKERFLNSKKKLWEKAIKVDAEIYQLHDPDLLPIGNELKKIGKKVIFDSHEDVPQQIRDKQWIPKIIRNLISKVYEIYEKHSISKYDGVISVTPHIVDRLKHINSQTIMITNYPIVDKEEVIERRPERAICFAGGIHEQYKHHNILEAIKNMEDLKYYLAGVCDRDYLRLLKSHNGWGKVEYFGKILPWEVKDMYKKSICGVAIHESTQVKGIGSLGALKLFEFMEAKLPVICTNYTLWKEIIDEYGCGIYVDPNNVNEIRKAIEYIINNPEEANRMGENGRRAVLEKYNWDLQEEELYNLYCNIKQC